MGHIFRCITDSLKPGSLRTEPLLRNRTLDFIADTVKYLANTPAGQLLTASTCMQAACWPLSCRAHVSVG